MERERERMVEEQLAARGITDTRVLETMRRIPRHVFVDEGLAHSAYDDHPLPIGEEQKPLRLGVPPRHKFELTRLRHPTLA